MSAALVELAHDLKGHDASLRPPGAVKVRQRVVEKVVREASAAAIGVSRADVSVETAEWGGLLDVRVSAKLPIPDLGDAAAIAAEVPLLDRLRKLQDALAAELAKLTGKDIRRVAFAVTGAVIPERKRVK